MAVTAYLERSQRESERIQRKVSKKSERSDRSWRNVGDKSDKSQRTVREKVGQKWERSRQKVAKKSERSQRGRTELRERQRFGNKSERSQNGRLISFLSPVVVFLVCYVQHHKCVENNVTVEISMASDNVTKVIF